MTYLSDIVTASSCVLLRIPGHPFPPLIATFLAINITSFTASLLSNSSSNVKSDRKNIATNSVSNGNPKLELLRTIPTRQPEKETDSSEAQSIEKVDVYETVILEGRGPDVLKTLLTGIPSPSSRTLNLLTALFNLLCAAMVADLTYRAMLFYPSDDLSFSRIGFIAPTTAKFFIREPDTAKVPLTLSYRHAGPTPPSPADARYLPAATTWKFGGKVTTLTDSTDYTATLMITRLTPDTRYQYAWSNNQSGYFMTAPRVGEASLRNNGKFTFLHTSCVKPAFPYSLIAHPLSIPGFKQLAAWLGSLKPNFLIFLGDFIYIDVPRRFGSDAAAYRRAYRQVYASPDWESVSRPHQRTLGGDSHSNDIPWLHVYDDHEIANDWDANTTGVFSAAFDPYNHYHVAANPPSPRPRIATATYFSFTQGPASFFLLDTRRFRHPSREKPADDPTKSMLGAQQLADLIAWLKRPETNGISWKFLISSVPFTKNWRLNAQDTWAGYLVERQVILEAMWDLSLTAAPIGVVILSGDRHEFAATAFPPPLLSTNTAEANPSAHVHTNSKAGRWPQSATVHEFSASPLNMFYLPVRTYRQTDLEDVCVKYIPDGNSKFGSIEIEATTSSEQSVLRYRLFVDGKEAWSHVLVTAPKIDGVGGRALRDGIWG